jgi:hypothetical protein
VEADADPIPADEDSYDFGQVTDMLDGTANHWDVALLGQVGEAALDLAEYCHLERVSDLLAPDTELGAAMADVQNGDDDDERPAESEVAVLAEQWHEVVAQISSCLRWHD